MDKSNTASLSPSVTVQTPQSLSLFTRFIAALIIFLALISMFFAVRISLSKPFIMDEMEFPSVAQAIVETGKPNYYRGEAMPSNQGLWHPPLYILTLAFWQRLFGSSIAASRTFGLFNAALAVGLVGWFVMRRWNTFAETPIKWLRFVALFFGLFTAATAPLLLQGSILPDIDTQVLPLTLAIMFLTLFELRRAGISNRTYWLIFIALMTFQLFAKLTTPILLIPAFIMFELVRGFDPAIGVQWKSRNTEKERTNQISVSFRNGWKDLFVQVIMVLLGAIISLLLLLGIWYVMANVWGVNFNLPFIYLTQSTNNPVNFSGGQNILSVIIAGVPENFSYVAQWFGLPALAFLGLMVVREFFLSTQGLLYRWERAALYTFLALLILMYIVLRPAPFLFPKYYPPLIIPLALLVLDLLFALCNSQHSRIIIGLIVIELGLYFAYSIVRRSLAGRDFIYAFYTAGSKETLTNITNAWMMHPLLALMFLNGIIFFILRLRLIEGLLVGAVAVTLGWQINVILIQGQASYSTTYYYSEDSLADITKYLREKLPEGAIVVAPKDVGVRLQDQWRYIELTADPRLDISKPGVGYLVLRTNDYYGNTILQTPEIADVVRREYVLATTVKNFAVFRHNGIP